MKVLANASLLAVSIALSAAVGVIPARAEPVTDCPLREMPFSAETPLLDIMLSPAARAAVNEAMGMSLTGNETGLMGTQAPTFAAILTLEQAAYMMRLPPDRAAKGVAALEGVTVSSADMVARCARYDNDQPTFELTDDGSPKILIFEKINGFKDVPSFDAAHDALMEMGKRNGWTIVASDKGGSMTPEVLAQFDAVVWNNISGDVLTLSQRQALRDYIEGGGGFVGLHGSAGDHFYFWDWYVDTLIGARFIGHPMEPQFQDARIVIDDASHPAAARLPGEWHMTDEWYSFGTNPRDSGARIIARLDETTYNPVGRGGQQLAMEGDHPIAWSKIVGKGRSFYSAIGHVPDTYTEPHYNLMLEDALAWAAGLKQDCPGD